MPSSRCAPAARAGRLPGVRIRGEPPRWRLVQAPRLIHTGWWSLGRGGLRAATHPARMTSALRTAGHDRRDARPAPRLATREMTMPTPSTPDSEAERLRAELQAMQDELAALKADGGDESAPGRTGWWRPVVVTVMVVVACL